MTVKKDRFMKKASAILFFAFLSFVSAGQINRFGVPLIKNYGQELINGTDYIWSIAKDNLGVVYMGTNGKGILRYDGYNWSVVKVPEDPVIRSLEISHDGIIYAGGSSEFGYLQPSLKGTTEYVSISERFWNNTDTTGKKNIQNVTKAQIGEIYSIIATDSIIYFCGLESLFLYYPDNDSVEFINLREDGFRSIVKMALIHDRIFFADNIKGLYELKNKYPVPVPGGDFFNRKICTVLLPSDEHSIFIGTYLTGVFKFDYVSGEVSNKPPVADEVNESLKRAQILSACITPDGEILLGTQLEGVFVFDRNFNFIGKWDSNTSNLPDNTVTAFYVDDSPSSELWISTTYNVSKVSINLPYYELSNLQGLEGAINNIARFNNSIYVATDIGLFKSYTDKNGYLKFDKTGNLSYQTFYLITAHSGKEEFLLSGTGMGLYCIKSNGHIYKVDDVVYYQDELKKSSYYVRSILQSKVDPEKFYIGRDKGGIAVLEYDGKKWKFVNTIKSNINGYVASMIENKKGDLFIYSGNPAGLLFLAANDSVPVEFTIKDGLPEASINNISKINDQIIAVTGKGLYRYDDNSAKWISSDELLGGYTQNLNCRDFYQDGDGDFWLSVSNGRLCEMFFKRDSSTVKVVKGPLNVMPDIEKFDLKHFDNRVWIPKSKSIYVIDKGKMLTPLPQINTLLSKIVIGSDSILMAGTFYKTLSNGKRIPVLTNEGNPLPEIKYSLNSISFFWSVPYFTEEDANVYSYKLEGFDKSWSKWEKVHYKDFTNLPYGKYTFRVKAKTITDIETNEAVFDFYILKPWYLTTVMIILYLIAFTLAIIAIIKAYTRKLKNENIRLEGIVAERTAVVVKQKEELESSIYYARRIQMALLPSETILSENINNYFILFKPRDIVSGDFYWMTKKDNRLYVVAADCTGHGVPGAFMSLLGMSFLDEIIDNEPEPRADLILSKLRLHVTESLKQSGSDDETKDGMDMALLVFDFNKSRIEFSGAYNPCFKVRRIKEQSNVKDFQEGNIEMSDGSISNGKYVLETIYASKMPIGISSRMDEDFVFYEWELEKDVSFYLFTDGYIDQFGGPHGRKFMKKNFKRLILDIQDFPMKQQKEILEQRLKEWMGQTPQIDDILVIGLKT